MPVFGELDRTPARTVPLPTSTELELDGSVYTVVMGPGGPEFTLKPAKVVAPTLIPATSLFAHPGPPVGGASTRMSMAPKVATAATGTVDAQVNEPHPSEVIAQVMAKNNALKMMIYNENREKEIAKEMSEEGKTH